MIGNARVPQGISCNRTSCQILRLPPFASLSVASFSHLAFPTTKIPAALDAEVKPNSALHSLDVRCLEYVIGIHRYWRYTETTPIPGCLGCRGGKNYNLRRCCIPCPGKMLFRNQHPNSTLNFVSLAFKHYTFQWSISLCLEHPLPSNYITVHSTVLYDYILDKIGWKVAEQL